MPDEPVVDVHSHLYPRWYLDRMLERTTPPMVTGEPGHERFVPVPGGGWPIDESFWSLEAKLAYMDAEGIEQAVVSPANPWLAPFGREESLDLARRVNQDFASFAAASGGRVVGLGILPESRVVDALAVIEEVSALEGLRGLITGPAICRLPLDSRELDPVWDALERSRLPLFLHPANVIASELLQGYGGVLAVALAFPFETSIWLARMALAGVFDRFPRMRLVAAHGGGTLPFLAGRLDAAARAEADSAADHATPGEQLSGLFLDLVVYHESAVRAAVELVGSGHVAFGSDHPFAIADARGNLAKLSAALEGSELQAARADTARRLFDLEQPPRS